MEEHRHESSAEPPPADAEAASALRRAIEERLAERDRDGVILAGLDAVRTGTIGIADVYTQVLGPLMTSVGAAWQHGRTRVWEEHFATQSVRDLVDALAPNVVEAAGATPRANKRVLLACPQGEQHDLGLRMLADRFRLAGWDVFYLGTDTPTEEIADAAHALDAELLVLSASTHFNRTLLRTVADELRAALPGIRLAVGGSAFARDRKWPAEELLDASALGLPGALTASARMPAIEELDDGPDPQESR